MFVDAEPSVAFAVPLKVTNAVLLYAIPDNMVGEDTAMVGLALTNDTDAVPVAELPFTLADAEMLTVWPIVFGKVHRIEPKLPLWFVVTIPAGM